MLIQFPASHLEAKQSRPYATMAYSFAGGYADAIGYFLAHTFTGHVTGNLVLLAVSLQHPNWLEITRSIVAIVGFLLATGFGFRIARFGALRSPWTLFITQAAIIGTVSLPLIRESPNHDLLLVTGLCLALGLQNGAITSAGGVSLHATFLSGDITSLIETSVQAWGFSANNRAKEEAGKSAKLTRAVLLGVVASFVGGACCASMLVNALGSRSTLILLFPLFAAAMLATHPTSANR